MNYSKRIISLLTESVSAISQLLGAVDSGEIDEIDSFDRGILKDRRGNQLVYVGYVARGDVTFFFFSLKTKELYYNGERPDRSSDGMEMREPWASASRVSLSGFSFTGEKISPSKLPSSLRRCAPTWDDYQ